MTTMADQESHMKMVQIHVFVDVDNEITPERVLHWVDSALEEAFASRPLGFETYQTGISQIRNKPVGV